MSEPDEWPVVTVVVPARNASATIEAQLRALDAQTGIAPFRVIVVDNDSSDGTGDMVRAFRPSRYQLDVVHEGERGINHARNAGVAAAQDGVIALCDADDEASPTWLAALVGALAPRTWVGGAVDYNRLNSARTRDLWNAPTRSAPRAVDGVYDQTIGCNCAFERSAWESVGCFDPRLNGVGDENEFFLRMAGAGYTFVHAADAVVYYRLRVGLRAMMRHRFRQGEQGVLVETLPGGGRLTDRPDRRATAWGLVRALVAAPKYLGSGRRRTQWAGSIARRSGRLVGLWRYRRDWSAQP